MKAAEDGNVSTMVSLIQDKKIDVNTHGPDDDPWVS